MTDIQSFYQYLDQIKNRGVRPSLERIQKAAQILGNPQNNYKVIHIAGTNGKGSVCSFLSQLLVASGYKVGMTLSPHVDDYRERIQISGNLIPVEDLLKTHEYLISKLPDNLGLTYFEWGVLLAIQYFSDQKVDFAVLETGLGGRWDATNICDSILSGITTIGYDHMQYLGESLEEILIEKLQIVKKGSDFLFGPLDEKLADVARGHCLEVGSQIHMVDGGRWTVDGRQIFDSYLNDNFIFALSLGKILEQRGYAIDFQKFLNSDSIKVPPARMEIIHDDPVILMDGAHNENALYELKKYLKKNYQDNYDLVFGCLSSRSFLKLAEIIRSPHQNYWACFDGDSQTTPQDVYLDVQKNLGGDVVALDEGFKINLMSEKAKRPVVVCGSFYLCSQFRRLMNQECLVS